MTSEQQFRQAMRKANRLQGVSKAGSGFLQKDDAAFSSGVSIVMQELHSPMPFSMPVCFESEFYFSIAFQLSGKGAMVDEAARKSTTPFDGPVCGAGVLRGSNNYTFQNVESIRSVNVYFSRQGLETVLGEGMQLLPKAFRRVVESDSEGYARKFCALNPAMQLAAHQAFQCRADAPQRDLFLESKALELVSLFLDELQLQGGRSTANPERIPPDKQDKLQMALHILHDEISAPPSIAGLANRVSLNTFDLKRMFKVRFGTTIYTFVRDERMRRARMLLGEGHTVSEAATQVGFNNFSYFAHVFHRYYGILPSKLRQ